MALTPRTRAAAQVAASAACFGTMAVFARQAYREGVDPLALLSIRFGLAGAVMVLVMRYRGHTWPRGQTLLMLCAMGGVGYVSQSLSFFSALQYAPAALVALLLYLHPFMIAVASRVLWRAPLTGPRLACVFTALAGTALVLGLGEGAQWPGYMLGVLAAVLYSAYLMTGQRVLARVTPLAASSTVILSAALVFGVIALFGSPRWPHTMSAWSAAVAIALISTVLAILLLFAGMKTLGATDAATMSTLEPVVTAVLAALLLGETLTLFQWFGVLIVVGAVLVLVRLPGSMVAVKTESRQ